MVCNTLNTGYLLLTRTIGPSISLDNILESRLSAYYNLTLVAAGRVDVIWNSFHGLDSRNLVFMNTWKHYGECERCERGRNTILPSLNDDIQLSSSRPSDGRREDESTLIRG